MNYKKQALVILLVFAAFVSSMCTEVRASQETVIGTVQLTLTTGDEAGKSSASTLGSACADALILVTGADFSLIASGDLASNLTAGDKTQEDIDALFTDADTKIVTAEVTAVQLCAWLEYGLSHITLNDAEQIDTDSSAFDGFLQIGGFKLTYDASARAGERVMRIMSDGVQVDTQESETVYLLALSASLFEIYGYTETQMSDTEYTLGSAMAAYAAEGIPDVYSDSDRIIAAGSQDSKLINRVPVLAVILAAVLGILLKIWWNRRTESAEYS